MLGCLAVSLALGVASSACAAEGGSGLYLLGFEGPQAGMMPAPGTYGGYNFFAYGGTANATVSQSSQVSVPGTGLKLPTQVNGDVHVETDMIGHVFTLTHVFDQKILGGNAGVSVLLPYANADLDIKAHGLASLTTPRGTLDFPFDGKRSESRTDLGDMDFVGMMGWHEGSFHYLASLNLYAPTGSYDKNRAVNIGRNHWAIDPMAQITYLDEKTGLEFSSAAGLTFNQMNDATNYQTGDELHLDVAAIEHFSDLFYLGFVGYGYHQVTDDSGSGATSGFRGRVYGMGPIVGGAIPLSATNKIYANVRYYQETGAQNRLEGHNLIMTLAAEF